MEEERTAALFMNEGSQAVRLPDEFRFEGDAVRIRKEGNRVILEPIEKSKWPRGFWEYLDSLGPLPDDFDVPEPLPPSPHRDEILEELGKE